MNLGWQLSIQGLGPLSKGRTDPEVCHHLLAINSLKEPQVVLELGEVRSQEVTKMVNADSDFGPKPGAIQSEAQNTLRLAATYPRSSDL